MLFVNLFWTCYLIRILLIYKLLDWYVDFFSFIKLFYTIFCLFFSCQKMLRPENSSLNLFGSATICQSYVHVDNSSQKKWIWYVQRNVMSAKQLIDSSFTSLQKFKDGNSSSELNSLKYTQKLIDLRLSYLQSNKSGWFKNNFN